MFLDEIYSELYAIAGHVGPLGEESVRGAALLLAQPRYATSETPAALLVDDLERVIRSIPVDEKTDDEEERRGNAPPAYASRYFQAHARRYFSLDGAGEGFSHRRAFGRAHVNGSVVAWTNRGVVYRVAAGLLDLWIEEAEDPALTLGASEPAQSYAIDSVRAAMHIGRHPRLSPAREVLSYNLRVLTQGLQTLELPFVRGSTDLIAASTEPGSRVDAQMAVGSRNGVVAVLFGRGLGPCEPVRIRVGHKARRNPLRPVRIEVEYLVAQPTGRLTLEVEMPTAKSQFAWQVTVETAKVVDTELCFDTAIIDEPASGGWSCEDPKVNATYKLRGVRVY